jgi:hypothetical protein
MLAGNSGGGGRVGGFNDDDGGLLMQSVMNVLMSLFSVLMPAKMWFAPGTPIQITVKSEGPVNLVMLEATGKPLEKRAAADNIAAGKEVDVRAIFPEVNTPGAYYLFAVPAGKTINEFVGTPIVFTSRSDKRQGGNELLVTKAEPLRYAVIQTEAGNITCGFYYESAPNTIATILDLASQGYYDGLTFHRIVPDFVIQGGDPMGNGRGGPGFQIDAEFNDKPHEEGVLSMARTGDPLEAQGLPPRCEAANSAGRSSSSCCRRRNTWTASTRPLARPSAAWRPCGRSPRRRWPTRGRGNRPMRR